MRSLPHRGPLAAAFLFLLLAAPTTRAQDASPTDSKSSSESASTAEPSAELRSMVEGLDAKIEQARQRFEVPGVAIAIVKDGHVVHAKGYGFRRSGEDEAVDEHTLFAIASNSKAFTASALAILVDEGKLRWDDRVEKYLPWLELSDPQATHDLRVADLLCHRSGLGTFSGDLLWFGTSYSPEEILRRARHLKPEGPFRGHFGYSNLMFLAAGEVIQSVSGQSWDAFIEQRILQPLDMDRTTTSVRDIVSLENYATPHKTLADRSQPIAWVNWDNMAAAGGIVSSVHDMAPWLQLQLSQGKHGGQTIFSAARSHEMWQAHTPIAVTPRSIERIPSTHFRAYGLGWMLSDYKGNKLVAHGGGYDGMYSHVMLVPEKNLGVVVLTNSMTSLPDALAYTVVDAFLGDSSRDWISEGLESFRKGREAFRQRIVQATTPTAEGTQPSHPLDAFAGTYTGPLYGDANVGLEDGKLVLRLAANPELVADLTHLHYDTFVIRWRKTFAWFDEGTAHFVADARGRFVQLQLDVPNDDLWFHELELRR
jgi:CubicO group peptidase (beta-lactamase class C family)